ncbi:MAG: hypothetical protein SXU28_09950, partial [Pseudomonadota bacterium]|nr:hypothetical protein [Pseudomonadota bacterium]
MPEFDQSVVNQETIDDNVALTASGITFTNTELGRVLGQFSFGVGGSTLVNELGGVIGPDNTDLPLD